MIVDVSTNTALRLLKHWTMYLMLIANNKRKTCSPKIHGNLLIHLQIGFLL